MAMIDAHNPGADGNPKSILAVLVAAVLFTVVDVMMKLTSASLPVGEMMVIRNGFSTALILAYGLVAGGLALPPNPPWRRLGWRMVGEGGSTITFLTALAMMPIADAAGVGQFGPLALTAAAAIFLGEHVGWRRWTATFVGFLGVMLIIRPGSGTVSEGGFLVLASIALSILRDFMTRAIAFSISTLTLIAMSSIATLIAGFVLMPFEIWIMPKPLDIIRLGVAGLALIGGYAALVIAMRHGQVSAANPFRYSAMIFALLAGWLIWNEVPDALSLTGIAIVCAAGLYALERERMLKSRTRTWRT